MVGPIVTALFEANRNYSTSPMLQIIILYPRSYKIISIDVLSKRTYEHSTGAHPMTEWGF